MAMDFDTRLVARTLLLGAAAASCILLVPLTRFLIRPFISPLRVLRAPKSDSLVWGHVGVMKDVRTDVLDEWVEEYGRVFRMKSFFNVSDPYPSYETSS